MAAILNSSGHTPFNFDTVFDEGGAVAYEPPRQKRSFTPEEVEQVRQQAFAEGERSAIARAEHATAAALEQVAASARLGLGALAEVAHSHRADSAHLAMAAARKIADSALSRHPEAPVAAALEALSREVEASPRLVVKVAADAREPVQAVLDRLAESLGHPGRIEARAEPGFAGAAFVLDWGDGRAAFDPEDAARRIQDALDQALAAEGLHAEPLIPQDETHG
ncbi:flagellar assembly protein FliH [Caulobacter sp. SLTY]|uniref:flagellar assembly protein FliH n=1 Tax=Caulobacter sp. SLTY TaxID=2683262 RepID=UPI001412E9F7|nr:flagellar assembly protein FliH [Caulobacter sp. SLTY]NBB16983.1 flagellar assembly protein FliH [Caulobacter sp. SLTY]